jgi:hypothetical protein
MISSPLFSKDLGYSQEFTPESIMIRSNKVIRKTRPIISKLKMMASKRLRRKKVLDMAMIRVPILNG